MVRGEPEEKRKTVMSPGEIQSYLALIVPAVLIAVYYSIVLLYPGPVPGFERDFTIVEGRVHREPTRMYFIYSINILAGLAAAIVILIRGYLGEKDPARRRRAGGVMFF